jgi:hypothetical protein
MVEYYSYLMFKDKEDPAPKGWEKYGRIYYWIGGNPPGDCEVGHWSILCRKVDENTQKS